MMKQCINSILFIIAVGGVLTSCSDDRLNEVTVTKELPAFNWIKLHDVFDVYLIQDSVFSITMEGSREFVDGVNWYLEGKELIIEDQSSSKFIHPDNNKVKLYIRCESLTRIKANESCYIETLNTITSDEFNIVLCSKLNEAIIDVNCKKLNYWNYFPCGGKITIRGYTDQLNIWNSALMSVEAKKLVAKNAMVKNGSIGDCEIFVTNTLEYSVNGEGNIYVFNQPDSIVQQSVTSSGKLIVLSD